MEYYTIKNKYFGPIILDYLKDKKITTKNYYNNIDYYNSKQCLDCLIVNQLVDVSCLGNKKKQYQNNIKYNPRGDYLPFTMFFTQNNVIQIKKNINRYKLWIVKPENGTFRRGIFIVNNYQMLVEKLKNYQWNNWIIQQYIDKPLLYNGFKFHIRSYILVIIDQHIINTYLYVNGFIYLSKKRYNYNSIDESYLSGEDSPNSVRNFPDDFIKTFGYDKYLYIQPQLTRIVDETIKSVKNKLSCYNTNQINYKCYKLLGYDILIDDNYKLYLGEINVRLITFKYPPPKFKNILYRDILDLVLYQKKSNRFKLIHSIYRSNTIEMFSNYSNQLYLLLGIFILISIYKYII